MRANRVARIRRLIGDLRRPETRGDAVRRVRRRILRLVRPAPGTPAGTTRGSTHDRPSSADGAQESKYSSAWSQLAGSVLGDVQSEGAQPPGTPLIKEAIRVVGRQRAEATLADALAHGESLEAAVCRTVAALAETQDWRDLNTAWALADGVARLPGGELASVLGHAVLLHRRRHFERVWNRIRELSVDVLKAYIPVEAVDAALAAGTPESREVGMSVGTVSDALSDASLVDLAGRFLAFGERERARDLVAQLARRQPVELDPRRRYAAKLITRWLDARPPDIPPGAVPIAIVDYKTPDHVLTSGNLGDYVQSLALLGNLVRFEDVRFSGEDGLGDLATELKERVRSDLRVSGVPGAVHLVAVDREFSTAREVPEGTWMFAFGWHMHPLYDLRYDFPYHGNIRPLFISFHVNRLDMLTEEALAYLRDHAPIGCRDWTTVFLLLSAGIEAFFSGCVSTTVDALFPRREAAYPGGGGGPIGYIDIRARSGGVDAANVRRYSHQSDEYRYMSMAKGLRTATKVLESYQRELDRVVTGRLHAFLPLTALGVPVDFRTTGAGDVRFAGLTDLRPGDERLIAMQVGLRELTSRVLAKILGGASETEVYELWRDQTRSLVAEARARFEAPTAQLVTTIDTDGAVASSLAQRRQFGPHDEVDPNTITDVVLALDQNLTYPLPVLIESMVANASGPLRMWILGRGLSPVYQEWLASAFPTLPITFLPCDHITYAPDGGRPTRIPARITISTMDRLLLPGMLTEIDRVLYLDIDTLVLGDICELARIDLEGHPLAARHSTVSEASEWFRAVRRVAEPDATEFRRRMFRDHAFGHPALNAGVMVLDLERMRRDDFTKQYLAWVERYGLNDQDTMLAYVGPDRRVIDPSWNALPHLEDVEHRNVIHWTSLSKPWETELTFAQEEWRAYAARVEERAGSPPLDGPDTPDSESTPTGTAMAVDVGP